MSSSTDNLNKPTYVEILTHFFEVNGKENYNLLEFYNQNENFIIANTTQWDVKGVWKRRFKEVGNQLNKDLTGGDLEPDWENIKRLIFESTVQQDETNSPKTLKKRKPKSSQSSSSSISAVRNLAPSNYEALSLTFKEMHEKKKWKLADNIYAEDILYEYAKTSKKENMAHSFVINVKDAKLKEKYGEYWEQILSANKKALPALPDHLTAHLEKISSLKSFEEIDQLKSYSYHQEKDLHVSTLCLKFILNTSRNGFFNRSKILENDILVNIWSIVDQMMNSYNLVAKRGEPCSVSSAARRNKERNAENMKRKRIGRRNDLIICSSNGMELGCGEAGLEAEEFDTKVIVESGLKTPKIMHDMFVRLCSNVENNETEIRELKVVGLIFSRFKICMLIMDCPSGYVCRLRSTKTVMLTGREELLGREFSKVYQLLWKAKEICQKTEEVINGFAQNQEIDYDSDSNSGYKTYPPNSLQSPSLDYE